MATVAGLVIGGVALVTLFDTASSAFDKIEDGRKYGKNFKQAVLQLQLLHLRLGRWRAAVELHQLEITQFGTPKEGKLVKKLLGSISDELDGAEKIAARHELDSDDEDDDEGEDVADARELLMMEKLATKVNQLALKHQKRSSLRQTTRWALRDKRKMSQLLSNLDHNLTQLENLFPAVASRETILAVQDAEELIKSDSVEEPGDAQSQAAAKVLAEAANGVDKQLLEAMRQVVSSRNMNFKQVFGGVWTTSEESQIQVGNNTYADGRFNTDHDIFYTGTFGTTKKSQAHFGNNAYGSGASGAGVLGSGGVFGGKGVFD